MVFMSQIYAHTFLKLTILGLLVIIIWVWWEFCSKADAKYILGLMGILFWAWRPTCSRPDENTFKRLVEFLIRALWQKIFWVCWGFYSWWERCSGTNGDTYYSGDNSIWDLKQIIFWAWWAFCSGLDWDNFFCPYRNYILGTMQIIFLALWGLWHWFGGNKVFGQVALMFWAWW